MSHFLDRLTFFTRPRTEFSGGHGVVTNEDRTWEDGHTFIFSYLTCIVTTWWYYACGQAEMPCRRQ